MKLVVILDVFTECCGSKLILNCDGVYRCPCGKNQGKAVKKQLATQKTKKEE